MKKTSFLNKLHHHLSTCDTAYIPNIHHPTAVKHLHFSYNRAYHIFNQLATNLNKNATPLTKGMSGNAFPAIYGTIKIHKENEPIRPIIADADNPLKVLQETLKTILKLYMVRNQSTPISSTNLARLITPSAKPVPHTATQPRTSNFRF